MNKNLGQVKISGIRKFYNEVQKVPGAISLTLGQPDFDTPDVIKKAMFKAIEENKTVYTENKGIKPLREAISTYLADRSIMFDSEEICITVGGSEGLFSIFTALLNNDDKVLIPTPAYPAYENIVNILGGTVVNYKLNEDFSINTEEIEKLIVSNNIKYLVLSLPSNPTGAILSKAERDGLVKIIKERDIVVITDEIYEALCYEEVYSITQCKEILDKIIYVSGFSKMFSMTGLRVGYIACRENYMKEIMKVHQYNVSCATSISQYGALAGMLECKEEVREMRAVFNKRREYVYNRLINMGLDVIEPKGAFYVFPSIKKFGLSSNEFCLKLLSDYKVACVPGDAFGSGGEGYLRISYCYSDEELKLCLDKLEIMIKNLMKSNN